MQKMAPAATIAVFLLCCCFIASTDSQDVCDLYAATGTSVTVALKYTLKESDNLKWLKDATVIFMRRNKKVIIGKNDDVDSTGSLKLTKLMTKNRGRYTPEVHGAEGVSAGDLQSTRLCVLDRVQKPTVRMRCTDSDTNVTFNCSVGQNEKIEWFMDGEKLAENERTLTRAAKDVANTRFSCNVSNAVSFEISLPVQQTCFKHSPVQKPKVTQNCTGTSEVTFTCTVSQKDKYLEFKWFSEDKKLERTGEILTVKVTDVGNTRFFCNVSNPVSSKISDPAVQNCFNPSFPDELFGISIWVFIGGGAGFVLLVIVIVVVCCIWTRRKKRIQ
ncbi:uncharacterized protein LOC115792150 [Archocentrus centrarchus]|uniref:uncharacterized protein LOC115792150 n=1 Tax=Archocentrus centrarchus TaxID=63155 RepID=UPI0011EA4779|nr:uncharacterized protein LOC115792150 [Archocentrus centrarchus]